MDEKDRNSGGVYSKFMQPKKLVAFLLFAGVFFYCYLIIHYSTGTLDSYHGLYHSSYAYQLYNGIIPPTNPLAAEAPANIYWPWHLMVAGLMHIIKKSPLEVVALLNCLSLAASAVILFRYAREKLSFSLFPSLILSLLPFVILEFPYAFYFLLRRLVLLNLPEFHIFYKMIMGVAVDARSMRIVHKFFNQTSFPTVVALFYTAIYLDSKRETHTKHTYRAVEFVVLALLGLFNPIGLFVFDLWILSSEWPALMRRPFFFSFRKLFQKHISLVLVNLFVFLYVYSLSKHIGGDTDMTVDLKDSLELAGNVIMVSAVLLVGLCCRRAFNRDVLLTSIFRFMVFSLVAVNVLRLPDQNEYKMILLSTGPFTFLLVGVVRNLLGEEFFVKRSVKVSSAAFLIFMFVFCGYLERILPKAKQDPWVFEGVNTRIKSDATRSELGAICNFAQPDKLGDLQDACDWLRGNSIARAYIVTKPLDRNDLFMPVITQRRVFVANPALQTKKVKEFSLIYSLNEWFLERINKQGRFHIAKEEPEYGQLLAIIGNPEHLYALVEKEPQKGDSGSTTVIYENGSFAIHKLAVH